jgi:uncharacterized membrane protein YhdT
MSDMLEETVRVRIAATDAPGWRSVPCWFHVMVIGPLALVGLQLLVVRFRVSERPVPVFLT